MRKLIQHYKLWYEWQKGCLNTWYYKLSVLFGWWISPTFEELKGRKKARVILEQRRKNGDGRE